MLPSSSFVCTKPPTHVTIDHTREVRKCENTNEYKVVSSHVTIDHTEIRKYKQIQRFFLTTKKFTIQFSHFFIVGVILCIVYYIIYHILVIYRLPLYCWISRKSCNVCMYVFKSGYIFHKTSTIFIHISPFEYLTFSGQNFRPFLLWPCM